MEGYLTDRKGINGSSLVDDQNSIFIDWQGPYEKGQESVIKHGEEQN